MREVKFRGQRVDNGEWETGSLVTVLINNSCRIFTGKIDIRDWTVENFEVIPKTVGQFTGHRDKNGKEIFDGDIIRDTGEFAAKEPGIVEWAEDKDDYTYHCGFRVNWLESFPRRSHLPFWAKEREIEVIGNRFENPDLLGDS